MGTLGDLIAGIGSVIDKLSSDEVKTIDSYFLGTQNNSIDLSKPVTLSSIDEVQNCLIRVGEQCLNTDITLKYAIETQRQLLNNIQAPTLVDTAFDTLLYNLDKSIKNVGDNEKERIREVYALMIQNYVFFMDAKYQMKVKRLEQTTRDLLKQAGPQLAQIVSQIIALANEIPTNLDINIVFDEKEGESSLWNNFIDWWYRDKDIAEAESNFMESLAVIFKKLHKHRELLGQSMLLSGLVERYKELLLNYYYDMEKYNETINSIKLRIPRAERRIVFPFIDQSIITFGISAIIVGIVWFIKGQFPPTLTIVLLSLYVVLEMLSSYLVYKDKMRNKYEIEDLQGEIESCDNDIRILNETIDFFDGNR
ncbi:MAG: hypothetical protein MJZ07_02000 [Bacteroidales bacterium]|nr:hypothetical protein [Bacteroidales bacterium]